MNSIIWVILSNLIPISFAWADVSIPETPITWDQVKKIAEQIESDRQAFETDWKKKLKPFSERENKAMADASSAKANCHGNFDCIKKAAVHYQEELKQIHQESFELDTEHDKQTRQLDRKRLSILNQALLHGVIGEIERHLKNQEGIFTLDSQIKITRFAAVQEFESFILQEGISIPSLPPAAIFNGNADGVIVFQYFITKPQEGNPDRLETYQITGLIFDANGKKTSDAATRYENLNKIAKSGDSPTFNSKKIGELFSAPQEVSYTCHLYMETSDLSRLTLPCAYNIDMRKVGF